MHLEGVIITEPILKLTLEIPPRTKKNHQQILINKKTGRPFVTQANAYKAFEKACLMLIPNEAKAVINYPVNVKAVFYMQTKRKVDLANLNSAIHDILVSALVLADDNRDIIASTDGSRVYYDKEHPRVEITIEKYTEEGYIQWGKKSQI